MAKKSKMTKVQPAVETLKFRSQPVTENNHRARYFIDLAKAASIVNRRAYRQGRQWMVAGFTVTSNGPGTVTVSKLPVTWVASNSWEKTFRAWDKQQKRAIGDTGAQSAMSKYRDFKIAMTSDHSSKWYNPLYSLVPMDFSDEYPTGEWEISQIVLPAGSGAPTEQSLHMLGDDSLNSRGMILGYQKSRARVHNQDPTELEPEDSFFSDMFDVGGDADAIIDNATDKNDNPPYDVDNYPGSLTGTGGDVVVHDVEFLPQLSAGTGTTNAVGKLNGGLFPCGLLAVDWFGDDPADVLTIYVHMVPGNYRGYLAPPMTEL